MGGWLVGKLLEKEQWRSQYQRVLSTSRSMTERVDYLTWTTLCRHSLDLVWIQFNISDTTDTEVHRLDSVQVTRSKEYKFKVPEASPRGPTQPSSLSRPTTPLWLGVTELWSIPGAESVCLWCSQSTIVLVTLLTVWRRHCTVPHDLVWGLL